MVEDSTAANTGVEEDIAKFRHDKEEALRLKNDVLAQVNRVKGALRSADDVFSRAGVEVRRQKALKSKLEAELGDIQAAGQIDTSSLEADEKGVKGGLEIHAREMDQIRGEIEELNGEMRELKDLQTQAERARDELDGKFKDAERAVTQFQSSMNARKVKVQKAKLASETSEKKLSELMIKFDEQHLRYKDSKAMAEEQTRDLITDWDGQPLELTDRETRSYLEKQAQKYKKQMEEGRRKAGLEGRTIGSVTMRYQKAKAELNESRGTLDEMHRQLEFIQADYGLRKKKWLMLRKRNMKQVNKYFRFYMERKGFTGSVVVNTKQKTLTLQCQVDNSNDATKMTDVRQLSGGERSYTTLCLLMALGHVIETPFRLMDEYDVFLDEVSRQVTLTELLKYARMPEQMNRQFIIITPNNLNNVKTNDHVRIRRMPKPNRGNVPQGGRMDGFVVRGGV